MSQWWHIAAKILINIGSANGLSVMDCFFHDQAITWTNAKLLSVGPSETRFSEIKQNKKQISFKKMIFKCCL